MKLSNTFIRETKFAARDHTIRVWMFIVFFLSTIAVGFGLVEAKNQHAEIQRLIEADVQERLISTSKHDDWGMAAYYSFQLTFDAPSDFAFAAMRQRDLQPWKHRIRMLALEGQIYERDAGNPVLALVGRFDFAFLAAFILPLVLIMLLYDLRTSERTARRHELLEATAGRVFSLIPI